MTGSAVPFEFDGVGVRGRCAMATLIASRLRDVIAAKGDDIGSADAAISAMKRWTNGEALSGRVFSDLVYDEDGEGVALHTMDGEHTSATPEWTALSTAVMYVAWQAYQQAGERMPEDIAEVRDDTLADLDAQWRATPAFDPGLLSRAAAALRSGVEIPGDFYLLR